MGYILLIEDDRDIRETTLEFLAMENYEAIGFADGISALEYLTAPDSRKPSLILTDINMPKMDGPTFRASQLRHPSISAIPCVALSADPRADQRFADLNLSGILKKPIDLDQLLKLVTRFSGREPALGLIPPPLPKPNHDVAEDAAKRQHDLVNELSAAKMYSELALRAANLPNPVRIHLEKISGKLARALQIALGPFEVDGPVAANADVPRGKSASEKTVLLLDDSPDLRELFSAYLTPRGFRIQTAQDVNEAIDILKRGFPQLLLVDFHLGDTDVYHALDRLEQHCPDVFEFSKVVLFSATTEIVDDPRIFAYELKARDLRGIETVVRKYT